jgi:hypothetical protein
MGPSHQSNIVRAPVSILMSVLFSYPKSCTRPVKLSTQRLQENDHLEVDLLRMIEENVSNCGNWDYMRIHHFKMMLHFIQSLASIENPSGGRASS